MKLLLNLSLKRESDGAFLLLTAHGVWGTCQRLPTDAKDVPATFCPLEDGPELRRLIAYGNTFECLGYYENIATPRPDGGWSELGTREVGYPGLRGFGSESAVDETWTESVTLRKGHKDVVVKATPQKPVQVRRAVFITCGRKVRPEVPDGFKTV